MDGNTVVAKLEGATMASTHSEARTASFGDTNVMFALPRTWQPSRRGMLSNYSGIGEVDVLDFDVDERVRNDVVDACRNISKTHPTVRACVNVYSRYPVRGIRLEHPDSEMQRFYEELFLDDLMFKDFLIDVGKAYWVDGTVFVFGNWSDSLGVWVGEDILDIKDMHVVHLPFVGRDYVTMTPSPYLKEALRDRNVAAQRVREEMPEFYEAVMTGADVEISSDRLTVLANKDRRSDTYGTPPLLAAWNSLRLESRMNSAMMATADRLYAPLTMFTVGGTLPNGQQYIPSAQALDTFRSNLDAALASDFRAIVTHSGVQAQEVIRQTNMSVFKQDMDMYDERVFMAFGLSSSIIKPNSGTYATSALEFQVAAQIMASYQDMLIGLYNKQASMVAEAQGHYVKDEAGDVETEYREVWDEDSQSLVVREVPKLDFPKLKFDVINFKDEQTEREFRMELRKAGVPIADQDIAIGVDIDLEESGERYNRERIRNQTSEARRNLSVYESSVRQKIPVPPEVCQYMASAIPPKEVQENIDLHREDIETGAGMPGSESALGGDVVEQPTDPGYDRGSGDIDNATSDTGVRQRPEESDEQRADMPRAARRY